MTPSQHAKVLEALEIAQPARCGQSDELYAQEAALVREALSIMRAVQVGGSRNQWPDRTAVRSPSPHEVVTIDYGGKYQSTSPTEHEVKP